MSQAILLNILHLAKFGCWPKSLQLWSCCKLHDKDLINSISYEWVDNIYLEIGSQSEILNQFKNSISNSIMYKTKTPFVRNIFIQQFLKLVFSPFI